VKKLKCSFLKEPHGVTSQIMAFFIPVISSGYPTFLPGNAEISLENK
jgi:hypothetical protein